MTETVLILGASIHPSRYAHKAQVALISNGHTPVLVNPNYDNIDGLRCYPDLQSCPDEIDTITLYVNPDLLGSMVDGILQLHPERVIFNPGTESRDIEEKLNSAGIKTQRACTLVLLSMGQFTDAGQVSEGQPISPQ